MGFFKDIGRAVENTVKQVVQKPVETVVKIATAPTEIGAKVAEKASEIVGVDGVVKPITGKINNVTGTTEKAARGEKLSKEEIKTALKDSATLAAMIYGGVAAGPIAGSASLGTLAGALGGGAISTKILDGDFKGAAADLLEQSGIELGGIENWDEYLKQLQKAAQAEKARFTQLAKQGTSEPVTRIYNPSGLTAPSFVSNNEIPLPLILGGFGVLVLLKLKKKRRK